MKKYLIYLIVLAISVGLWRGFSSQSNPSLEESQTEVDQEVSLDAKANQILTNDYEKLIKNLKKENVENPNWEDIINYSQKVEDVVSPQNAKGILELSQANLPDLMSCLEKDFCGMTTRGEDDPYFDETATPAHQLIRRNLKIINEAIYKDPSLKKLVDWDLIENIALSDSEMIQVEALNLMNQSPANVDAQKLVALSGHYTGEAKAKALVSIAKGKKGNGAVAQEVQEDFAMKDANTVISILEKMNEMGLTKYQVSQALKNLCRFNETGDEAHNWKMIEHLALKLDSEFKKYCN